MSISLLPDLARTLALSVEELIGEEQTHQARANAKDSAATGTRERATQAQAARHLRTARFHARPSRKINKRPRKVGVAESQFLARHYFPNQLRIRNENSLDERKRP